MKYYNPLDMLLFNGYYLKTCNSIFEVLKFTKKGEITIVMGDNVGMQDLLERNTRGNCCTENNLFISNTRFKLHSYT